MFGIGKKKKSMTSAEYRELAYNQMSEQQHQEQLIYWLDKHGIYYEVSISGVYFPNPHKKGSNAWAIQNKANLVEIGKLKKQGWNKGQSDIKVYLKSIELQIELKKIGGTASDEQLKTQKIINTTKYAKYHIIEGYLACIELIEKHL